MAGYYTCREYPNAATAGSVSRSVRKPSGTTRRSIPVSENRSCISRSTPRPKTGFRKRSSRNLPPSSWNAWDTAASPMSSFCTKTSHGDTCTSSRCGWTSRAGRSTTTTNCGAPWRFAGSWSVSTACTCPETEACRRSRKNCAGSITVGAI